MVPKGIIFNIQKFSIHDGPGIRTTVFLKGCPLQCKWCSNPESQVLDIQIFVDKSKCHSCQKCIHICSQAAISYANKQMCIDQDKCIGCMQCMQACPNNALGNEGEYKDIHEIVEVCLQDKDFYLESNGGVTFSGGEAMSQPDFLKALVLELKKEHIHVAIETTGYIQPKTFKELAPLFDLLLYDVKHHDTRQHEKGTGVSNTIILNNLQWAIESGIEVLPRIPIIPDFNDSLEDAKELALLLLSVGASKVQLLPFHQFGENKYNLLQKEYALTNKKALYPEDLKEYQQVFINHQIDCFF